ncbi:hypothetical protein IKG73_02470 [Candidatus Saccharibacteria bacterium]|nr:hypothetical protein [Candidatus Saccharibacteria bacterium]
MVDKEFFWRIGRVWEEEWGRDGAVREVNQTLLRRATILFHLRRKRRGQNR